MTLNVSGQTPPSFSVLSVGPRIANVSKSSRSQQTSEKFSEKTFLKEKVFQVFYKKKPLKHRYTVFGNPWGGPWGFGQIVFRGVLGVVRKSRRSGPLFCVLLHLYVTIFRSISIEKSFNVQKKAIF